MIVKTYDEKKQMYIVKVSREEFEKALKSREAYRDFIFKTFGFHLTVEDFEKAEVAHD